jgi:hypothetical protein
MLWVIGSKSLCVLESSTRGRLAQEFERNFSKVMMGMDLGSEWKDIY